MEAYGLYYSYSQSWTHSSKGYLVHRTYLQRCTCLDMRKSTKFKRLSHYLACCVQRADFHFMEACGLYYLYTTSKTHSSNGYLVYGPYFPRYTWLDMGKCTMFKRLSEYLNHCVHRADCHLMETYGIYCSYSQSWTHSSKGYLVHGSYFLRRICLNTRNCTMFRRLSEYQNRCVQRTDFHLKKAFGLSYLHTQYWTHSL